MDTAERGAPDLTSNGKNTTTAPSTAASQLVAAALPHEAEEQLRNEKLEYGIQSFRRKKALVLWFSFSSMMPTLHMK